MLPATNIITQYRIKKNITRPPCTTDTLLLLTIKYLSHTFINNTAKFSSFAVLFKAPCVDQLLAGKKLITWPAERKPLELLFSKFLNRSLVLIKLCIFEICRTFKSGSF